MPEAITEFEPHLIASDDSGIGGQIAVRLWINDRGGVDDAELLNSALPKVFADAALGAFRQMRFTPGEVDGLPVRVWVDIVVEYTDMRKQVAQR
jgi:TonB family protein